MAVNIILSLVFVAVIFLGVWWLLGRGRRPARPPVSRRGGRGGGQRATLLKMAAGDSAKVDRLVAYERRRNPALDEEQAVRAAIDRWRRDQR